MRGNHATMPLRPPAWASVLDQKAAPWTACNSSCRGVGFAPNPQSTRWIPLQEYLSPYPQPPLFFLATPYIRHRTCLAAMLCSRPCSCSQGLSRPCGSSLGSLSRRRPDSSRSVVAFGKKGKKKGGGGGGGGGSQAATTTEAAPPDDAPVASSGDGELDVTNAIKACKDKMSKVRTLHCGERLLRLRSVSIANNAQK